MGNIIEAIVEILFVRAADQAKQSAKVRSGKGPLSRPLAQLHCMYGTYKRNKTERISVPVALVQTSTHGTCWIHVWILVEELLGKSGNVYLGSKTPRASTTWHNYSKPIANKGAPNKILTSLENTLKNKENTLLLVGTCSNQ